MIHDFIFRRGQRGRLASSIANASAMKLRMASIVMVSAGFHHRTILSGSKFPLASEAYHQA